MSKRLWFLVCVGILSKASLSADEVSLVVDPEQSEVTVSGEAVGTPVQSQGEGSLTSQLAGEIRIDVTEEGIQFLEGARVVVQDNGEWEPAADGAEGSAPANFGGLASSFLGTAKVAVRGVAFELTSLPVSLSEQRFDAGSILFTIPEEIGAVLDYRVASFTTSGGSEPLDALNAPLASGEGLFVNEDGTVTLEIPVDFELEVGILSDADSTFRLEGSLVATTASFPPLRIESIGVSEGTVTLEWTGIEGKRYRVESSDDLLTWREEAAGLEATDGKVTWEGSGEGDARYYRVLEE